MAQKFYNLDTDTSLGGASASDYLVPSQKAIMQVVAVALIYHYFL